MYRVSIAFGQHRNSICVLPSVMCRAKSNQIFARIATAIFTMFDMMKFYPAFIHAASPLQVYISTLALIPEPHLMLNNRGNRVG